MQTMYFIYILYSKSYDRFYIGQTDDLDRRLIQHNAGDVKSTKAFRPWARVYNEQFDTRHDAMSREHFLKKQKNKKFYRKLAAFYFGDSL